MAKPQKNDARKILFGPLPPPYGGVSVFMQNLAGHLPQTGVRVWGYGSAVNETEWVKNVRPRRLGILPALLKEGRGARITETAHFHLEYPNAALVPLWLASKKTLGFEWVKIIHDATLPERYKKFARTQRLLFNRCLDAIDEFVVVSPELGNWLRESLMVKKPVTCIPSLLPDVEHDLANNVQPQSEAFLKSIGHHARLICSSGVFIPHNGFACVADAVETLRQKTNSDIGLLLIDAGFAVDEGYKAQVLNGRDWITVLEQVPHPAVQSIFKQGDVFVRAFESESFGLAKIEAIWSGIPVVTSNTGETRGMLVFEIGDQNGLIEQIDRTLNDNGAENLASTAEMFRAEARTNLKRYIDVILGSEGGRHVD